MAPPAVLGTATLFCRPLRFLFDVESAVAVLRNNAFAGHDDPDDDHEDIVLGHVHVHISILALTEPADDDDDAQAKHTTDTTRNGTTPHVAGELAQLVGRFVRIRVRLQLLDRTDSDKDDPRTAWHVQYQLSPATESFLLPADHTNVFRVLVTDEFIAHVTTTALQFNFLPPRPSHRQHDSNRDTSMAPTVPTVPTPRVVAPLEPVVAAPVSAETELARQRMEAAASAAQSAAQAAREAARAATYAMEEAKAVAQQRTADAQAKAQAEEQAQSEAKAVALRDRDRAQEQDRQQLEREQEREREREQERKREQDRDQEREQAQERAREREREAMAMAEAKTLAAAAAHAALEKQQYTHELDRLSDEKSRLLDDTERLARALQEKDAAMRHWDQQTATTDAAMELLKQRLAGDAKERDELQRRLRVLEEEKLELQRKSRACVVQ